MHATKTEFLYSGILNCKGGADPVEAASTAGGSGPVWTHLDVHDETSRSWLENESGLDSLIIDTLLADETRPRSFSTEKGLLVVLRGVNTNPGADPEDMVSVRAWLERDRIISTRRRRLLSVIDIQQMLKEGMGPRSTGKFLTVLVARPADRIGLFIDDIEARVGEADRMTRYLEDLDLAREQAMVLREEFLGQLAQEQNSRMYVLSVVAAALLAFFRAKKWL